MWVGVELLTWFSSLPFDPSQHSWQELSRVPVFESTFCGLVFLNVIDFLVDGGQTMVVDLLVKW